MTIDVHGYSVKDALEEITKLVKSNKAGETIDVIHGFVHGNKIKVALIERGKNMSPKIDRIQPDLLNSGITHIYFKMNLKKIAKK